MADDEEKVRMTFGMQEEDLNEIVEYFEIYRMDPPFPVNVTLNDLPIDVVNLGPLLEDMGFIITESELFRLMEELDPEYKGYIMLATFLEKAAKPLFERSKVTRYNAEDIFQLFARPGNPFFGQDELSRILNLFGEQMPPYFVKAMLKEVDMDGDDLVSFDEFLFFLTGLME